jgi:hypothetical protein
MDMDQQEEKNINAFVSLQMEHLNRDRLGDAC